MEEVLWVEKYRPRKVEDTILPAKIKKVFKKFVDGKDVPNLILSGPSGVGKTTIARAILEELGCQYMMINASLDGGKDALRNEIRDFSTSMSISGGRKYIILDEADYLTHHMQPALRNFMEEYSSNVGFILTCNYPHKIIKELHSRCSVIEFKFTENDKKSIVKEMYVRATEVLDAEGIEYDKQSLAKIVKKYFPDFRKTLNELQYYSINGSIDSGILANFDEAKVKQLITLIKSKNIEKMRKWITENDIEQQDIFNTLFDVGDNYIKDGNNKAQAILILGEYQYRASFAANPQINLMAALVQLAIDVEWKE